MKTTKRSEPVFQRAGLHGDVDAGAVIGGGGGGGNHHRRHHADHAAAADAEGDVVVTVVAMAVMMGIAELGSG